MVAFKRAGNNGLRGVLFETYLSPDIKRAILEYPDVMTKVAKSRRDLLVENVLRETYGSELDEAVELERAIEVSASAIGPCLDAIRFDLGIYNLAEFDQQAAPARRAVAASWLRKGVEDGKEITRVIVPGEPVAREATAEQIASGIHFANFEEWQAATGGDAGRKVA